MPWGRIGAIAAAVVGVLWAALDSGFGGLPPAPPAMSSGLLALGAVFGTASWVMWRGGQPERSPLLAGMAIGLAFYAIARLTLSS